MIGMDVRYEDQIGWLGSRQVRLLRDRIDDDDLPTLLELYAGMPERSDDDVPAGSRDAGGVWRLGPRRRRPDDHHERHDRSASHRLLLSL